MRNIHVVDANVILRYLLGDHPEYFEKANAFMSQLKVGEAHAYIPEGVLIECVYVLLKVYRVPRDEIADKLVALLSYKGVRSDNRTLLIKSLQVFNEQNVDIVDAIVHVTAEERGWQLLSFDKDLGKLVKRKAK